MSSLSSRARWVAVVFAAFLGGLILASGGLNLSKLSFAQSKPDAQSVAPLVQASNAFVEIADHTSSIRMLLKGDIVKKPKKLSIRWC